MTIKQRITDGQGQGYDAWVDHRGALCVSPIEPPVPAVGSSSSFRFFSQLVSSNGDGTGTTNMNVNGTTPQTFTIDSEEDFDIRLMKILIFIEDQSVTHSGLGALAALSNGIDISVFEMDEETFLVKGGKKFSDLIRQTLAERPFGDDATSFELQSTTGTQDAQVLPMDLGVLVPLGRAARAGDEGFFAGGSERRFDGIDGIYGAGSRLSPLPLIRTAPPGREACLG